jgi:hypothetical protein
MLIIANMITQNLIETQKDLTDKKGKEGLVEIWKNTGCPLTPQKYYFDNIRDLSKIASLIKVWKGKEGIVLVYNKGQNKIRRLNDNDGENELTF